MLDKLLEIRYTLHVNNFIEAAYRATKRSTHPYQQMVALVFKGGSVLAVAHNTWRREGHCERRAIRPHSDMRGATIVVVRSNRGVSRPCETCYAAIRAAGIKKVIYIGFDREICVERI